ncbi:MAG TPA: TRAP transporter substrate-binding protein [Burkholderiales bacterium]|jgi:TRAP-type mannitol/chloroaromatic compound transport system substrate-binding protein|nr:TRAP transporter substrate-binding protein [Burkholderiales bacterium]
MQRRDFIKHGGIAGVLAAGSAPAFAQNTPIKWRLASSYPKTLDTLIGAVERVSKTVGELTNNRFQIQVFGPGEIVPALQVFDAVQNGTVEAGHTASYFYIGKNPAFGFGTAMPFGMNTRQQNAWLYLGGGIEMLNEFYKSYGVIGFPVGNTGAQMGGWFRKEIKTVADLKGLKMRIGGLGGMVLSKLGVIPQQIGGGDLYAALEKGVIDSAEWVAPYDDERLGLQKIAKYYYYPGWWEGCATLHLYINQKPWAALPKEFQQVLTTACAEANQWMTAKYDAGNPAALKRLVATGTQLRGFSRPIMEASYKAAGELYAELSVKSPEFKTIHDNYMKFRDEQILWSRICEEGFDNFMAYASQLKK